MLYFRWMVRMRPVHGDVPVETLPSHNEILGRPRGRRGVSSQGRPFQAGSEASNPYTSAVCSFSFSICAATSAA